jgi:hypothetical protein
MILKKIGLRKYMFLLKQPRDEFLHVNKKKTGFHE